MPCRYNVRTQPLQSRTPVKRQAHGRSVSARHTSPGSPTDRENQGRVSQRLNPNSTSHGDDGEDTQLRGVPVGVDRGRQVQTRRDDSFRDDFLRGGHSKQRSDGYALQDHPPTGHRENPRALYDRGPPREELPRGGTLRLPQQPPPQLVRRLRSVVHVEGAMKAADGAGVGGVQNSGSINAQAKEGGQGGPQTKPDGPPPEAAEPAKKPQLEEKVLPKGRFYGALLAGTLKQFEQSGGVHQEREVRKASALSRVDQRAQQRWHRQLLEGALERPQVRLQEALQTASRQRRMSEVHVQVLHARRGEHIEACMGNGSLITATQPPLFWLPVKVEDPGARDARVDATLKRLQQRAENRAQQWWQENDEWLEATKKEVEQKYLLDCEKAVVSAQRTCEAVAEQYRQRLPAEEIESCTRSIIEAAKARANDVIATAAHGPPDATEIPRQESQQPDMEPSTFKGQPGLKSEAHGPESERVTDPTEPSATQKLTDEQQHMPQSLQTQEVPDSGEPAKGITANGNNETVDVEPVSVAARQRQLPQHLAARLGAAGAARAAARAQSHAERVDIESGGGWVRDGVAGQDMQWRQQRRGAAERLQPREVHKADAWLQRDKDLQRLTRRISRDGSLPSSTRYLEQTEQQRLQRLPSKVVVD